VTKLAFRDLAAKLLAPEPTATSAAPNLDGSMRFVPDDPTDHVQRIAEARAREAASAAAVVAGRRAIEAAYDRLGEGVDPSWYSIEDDAWALVEDAPPDIESHREEALAEADQEDPDGEDPTARIAVDAAHDLALALHALLERLRETQPDLSAEDLQLLVNDTETIEAAEQAEARTLARFDVAADLRRRVEAYGEALHEYLVGWPEEERDGEEERVRELVFGE
jgi:hypothetical protein